MIKAVIFDMDGVLVNTEHYFLDIVRKHLDAVGAEYSEELINSFVGSNDPVMIKQLDPIVAPKISGKELIDRVNKETIDEPIPYDKLKVDGVHTVLTNFKNRGFKIGLASSSPRYAIETMMKDLDVEDIFDAVSSGEEYAESKPNPEIYLHTLEKLNVHQDNCVVIEDSEHGINAAKAAGAYVIAIRDHHFGMKQDSANCIVDKLVDSIQILDDLERNM